MESANIFIEDAPTKCPKDLWVVLDRFKIKEQNKSRCTEAGRKGLLSVQESIAVQIRTPDGNIEQHFHRFPYSHATQTRYPLPEPNLLSPTSSIGACHDCTGKGETPTPCVSCNGTGLNAFARQLKYGQWSFQQAISATPTELNTWLTSIAEDDPRLEELRLVLSYLRTLSVELPLFRRLQTLSTGERTSSTMWCPKSTTRSSTLCFR